MSASGTAERIRQARETYRAFRRSGKTRIMFDISGMRHADVARIAYGGVLGALAGLIRYGIGVALYPLPFSSLKVLFYRACGMRIGRNVYISPGVYLDLLCPSLISIGDNVMIGMGAKIAAHERTMRTLSFGRVQVGSGVTIGGLTVIRHATKIGDNAEIDMLCCIRRNVPRGASVSAPEGRIHHG